MARLLFFISAILIQLVTFSIAQDELIDHSCGTTGNYSNNSTYQANVNSLLSSISSNNEINYGFYKFSSGQNSDKVYAIALCRGDVTLDDCRSCINESSHKLTQLCPYQKEAIIWYDYFMLRYSNCSIFSTMAPSPFYRQNRNKILDSMMGHFNSALPNLLYDLQTVAASCGSLRKFAVGEANFSSYFQIIYARVQCTPDLSKGECNNCLAGAIADIPSCCNGTAGWRVGRASCNLRYEVSKFYESTVNSTSASSPPPINGKKSYTSQIVIIIIIVSTVSSLILIVCICIFLRMRMCWEKVETMDEIRSVDSLRFGFGTIRVATDNFLDANKLGQGGFGAVCKAWKAWMERRVSTLLDPTLRAGSRTEIVRCIHIGLLCVQENPADRPTMASVVLMLSRHSLTLPVLSRSAFFMHGIMVPEIPLPVENNSEGTESDQSEYISFVSK